MRLINPQYSDYTSRRALPLANSYHTAKRSRMISRPAEERVIPYCPQRILRRAFGKYKPYVTEAPSSWWDIHNCQSPMKCLITGRRGGKSTGLVNHIVRRAISVPKNIVRLFGGQLASWYVGPTYRQAKDIAWEKLKFYSAQARHRKRKPNETNLEIQLENGMWLKIKGADKPDRLEGTPLWDVGLDEAAEMLAEVLYEHLEPSLTDHDLVVNGGGHAFVITTPKGDDHWVRDLFDLGQNDPTGDVMSWRYASWQAQYANVQRLLGVYKRLIERGDRQTWEQEYGAQFIAMAGRIYSLFNRRTHVRSGWEINPAWTTFCSLDAGAANPTHALMGGIDQAGRIWVRNEWVMKGVPIKVHAREILNRFIVEGRQIFPTICVIDPSAKQWAYDFHEHGLHFSKARNDVRAGIERVKSLFVPEKIANLPLGVPKIIIHPDCPVLINQLLKYRWKPNRGIVVAGRLVNVYEIPLKSDDHGPDALRYIAATYHPGVSHEIPHVYSSLSKAIYDDIRRCTSLRTDCDEYAEDTLLGGVF